MVHQFAVVTLNQLMQMRVDWINENRMRVLEDAVSDMYNEVIDAFVHRGKNHLMYKIPSEVTNFPVADQIINEIVRDMRIIFPDLKFDPCMHHGGLTIFVDV